MNKKELSQTELKTIVGGKGIISIGGDIIKVVDKAFAGVCSLLDGWNKKKYTGGC